MPIEPVLEERLIVSDVRVADMEPVMEPEPLADRIMLPVPPVDTLALMAMPELLPLVESDMVAVPLVESADATVRVPPELTVTAPVVLDIVPRVVVADAPDVLMVSVLEPKVID